MLISFIWPFLTQDVPLYLTIHIEGGLVCVHFTHRKINYNGYQLHLVSNLQIQLLSAILFLLFHSDFKFYNCTTLASCARYFGSSF